MNEKLHFTPLQETFERWHARALKKAPLSGLLDPITDTAWSASKAKRFLMEDFHRIFIETQKANASWIESRFKVVREEFGLSMEDIVEAAQKNNTMLYPLTPFRDSTLFWFYHQGEEAISWVVNEAIGERLEVDNYPIDPGIASEMPDMIRMARIPRGKIGKGKLAKIGMASGRLGFWENISANIYWAGKYIPRVYADKSGVLDRQITISPLNIRAYIL